MEKISIRATALVLASVAAAACGDDSTEVMSVEQLMDPETCKECHEDHYREWSGSMHAYASIDPVFRAMNERGQDETGGDLGSFCVNCHAPLAVRTGATEDGMNLDSVPDHLQGVTCYFCHNVERVEGTHNNPLILAMDQTMRGNFADPVDNPAHRSAYSPFTDGFDIEASSSMCGSCHDIEVPKEFSGADEDVHLERTFQEYLSSIFPRDPSAASCGGCHMEARAREPIADFESVKERTRYAHTFPAVDVALEDFPERDEQLREIQRELNRSLVVTLCADALGRIRVTLDNIGPGHNFPSGASQDRRVWVEVIAYDENDEVIYSSGVVPDLTPVASFEGSEEDPDLWLLRDKAFEKDGSEAHMFWNIARIEERTIKPPVTLSRFKEDGTPDERYDNPIQSRRFKGAFGASRITVRVRVRPMGLEVIEELIDVGYLGEWVLEAFPTFDLLPNLGIDDPTVNTNVTLEWTSEAFDGDFFEDEAACVRVGKPRRN